MVHLQPAKTASIIMINGDLSIYVARQAFLIDKHDETFRDHDQFMAILARLLGAPVDGSTPIIERRLPDGTRVHMVLPPVAVNGPAERQRRQHARRNQCVVACAR